MNLKRIISGLIGFPIVVLIFLLGNKYVIDIAVTILAVKVYMNIHIALRLVIRQIQYHDIVSVVCLNTRDKYCSK